MAKLSPDQTSDCSYPELDIFITAGGTKIDVSSLEYIIFEDVTTPGAPIQVYPPSGRATANVADCPTGHRLSLGRYVAEWTVPSAEPIGSHMIQWFFKVTPTSLEGEFTEEFEIVPVGAGAADENYCSVAEMRDEGVTVLMADDDKLLRLIEVGSRYIDRYTGRFFFPRSLTLTMDGQGTPVLFFNDPVIDITSVTIELTPGTVNPLETDLNDIAVYNRHVTQNLTNPDDRDNPKIEFHRVHESIVRASPGSAFLVFPKAKQNITVAGVFGYTDYDGTTWGKTPDLIKEACMRIVVRLLPKKIKTAASGAGPIKREKTRDQEVEFGDPTKLAIQGAFTGDPEIDSILASYRRPPHMGAV